MKLLPNGNIEVTFDALSTWLRDNAERQIAELAAQIREESVGAPWTEEEFKERLIAGYYEALKDEEGTNG